MVEFGDGWFVPSCEVNEWSNDMATVIPFSLMIQFDPVFSIFDPTWEICHVMMFRKIICSKFCFALF